MTVAGGLGAAGFAGGGGGEFAVGSLRGVRWWTLPAVLTGQRWKPLSADSRLQGAYGEWRPGENRAMCAARSSHHDFAEIPVQSCGCGYWAYWRAEDAPHPPGIDRTDVLGVVEGYGAVLHGSNGFRAQIARIVALHVAVTTVSAPGATPAQRESAALTWQGVVEEWLEDVYQVPVYATPALMLHKHPPASPLRSGPEPVPQPGSCGVTGGATAQAGQGSGWLAVTPQLMRFKHPQSHIQGDLVDYARRQGFLPPVQPLAPAPAAARAPDAAPPATPLDAMAQLMKRRENWDSDEGGGQ